MSKQTSTNESESQLVDEQFSSRLILHNDDFNTFDWVIMSLISVCNHNPHQAEQCANIIHSKGKYAVKHGKFTELNNMRHQMISRGIKATIENY